MRTAEEIASLMLTGSSGADIQLKQTRFKQELAKHWQVNDGWRILEIGCGQGDMTAVLADAVGPAGHITALDPAPSNYGAPFTLGEASEHLLSGPLGTHITFLLSTDLQSVIEQFQPDQFDALVLAHCSWYFSSLEEVSATLTAVRPFTKRLLISEWDLVPRAHDQLGHFLAALLQGQTQALGDDSKANIRTPYSRESLHTVLNDSGWSIASEELVDSRDLDDGKWEIATALQDLPRICDELRLTTKHKEWLHSQLDVLKEISDSMPCRSLNSFALVAERSV